MLTVVADRNSKRLGATSRIMADSGRRMEILVDYRDFTAKKNAHDGQVLERKCLVLYDLNRAAKGVLNLNLVLC